MTFGDARRWLGEEAIPGGHDSAAVDRLLGADPGMLWTWLDSLPPQQAHCFVVAALQGLAGPLIHSDVQRNRIRREGAEFHAQHSAVYRNVLTSRQRGQKTDYLRAFLGSLEDCGFPLRIPGTNAAIVLAANLVLDADDVTPALVSKLRKAIG